MTTDFFNVFHENLSQTCPKFKFSVFAFLRSMTCSMSIKQKMCKEKNISLCSPVEPMTDQYKTAQYLPLSDKLQKCLGDAWSVEVVPSTIGVRGSYEETAWAAHLARFGLTVPKSLP